MAITINGSGITSANIADGTITDGDVDSSKIVTKDSSGRTGVGTTAPASTLHVKHQGIGGDVISEIGNSNISSANKCGFVIRELGNEVMNLRYRRDGTGITEMRTSNSLVLTTAGSERLAISSTGNANFTGDVSASSFSGDGSQLTGIQSGIEGISSDADSVSIVGGRYKYWANSDSTTDHIGERKFLRYTGSTGSSGQTKTFMRVKRQWWGSGYFKIRIMNNYYSGSDDAEYQLQGHSSIQYGGTMSVQKMYGDSNRISLSSRQTASPPATSGVVGWQDVKIVVPAYYQYVIEITVVGSTFCETDAEMANSHNCYRMY